MRLRLPYVRQPNDYSCGPASMKMALGGHGIRVSLRTLVRTLATNPRTGTARGSMARGARRYGLRVRVRPNGSLDEIGASLRRGLAVIVSYREPEADIGHYAVVVGVDSHTVTLNDPWHGPNFRLSRKEFLRRWYGKSPKKPRRWLLLVGKE